MPKIHQGNQGYQDKAIYSQPTPPCMCVRCIQYFFSPTMHLWAKAAQLRRHHCPRQTKSSSKKDNTHFLYNLPLNNILYIWLSNHRYICIKKEEGAYFKINRFASKVLISAQATAGIISIALISVRYIINFISHFLLSFYICWCYFVYFFHDQLETDGPKSPKNYFNKYLTL